jgi:hypothetical protein
LAMFIFTLAELSFACQNVQIEMVRSDSVRKAPGETVARVPFR